MLRLDQRLLPSRHRSNNVLPMDVPSVFRVPAESGSSLPPDSPSISLKISLRPCPQQTDWVAVCERVAAKATRRGEGRAVVCRGNGLVAAFSLSRQLSRASRSHFRDERFPKSTDS